jgi:hypothetical protein
MSWALAALTVCSTACSHDAENRAAAAEKRASDAVARADAAEKKLDDARSQSDALRKQVEEGLAKIAAANARADEAQQRLKSATSGNTPAPKPAPPVDSIAFAGHRYQLIQEAATWHVAKARCEEMGGHLATIGNQAEDDFVRTLAGDTDAWLGGNDEQKEGTWVWVTGEPFAFKHWSQGSPDNAQYVQNHLYYWNGRSWDDDSGDRRKKFVCEWEQ